VELLENDRGMPLRNIERHVRYRDRRFNHGGTLEFAAISRRGGAPHAIDETLSTVPKTFEPIIAQTEPRYRCGTMVRGIYAAMKLRLSAWAPLTNPADIDHALLLPILPHCVDDHGRLLLAPPRTGPQTQQLLRTAYKDIPAVVRCHAPVLDADAIQYPIVAAQRRGVLQSALGPVGPNVFAEFFVVGRLLPSPIQRQLFLKSWYLAAMSASQTG
jgi:uncharacterized protein